MEQIRHLVVIGSGISGLSLAYFASRDGMRVTVIEKNSVAGGTLHSPHHDDFWIELGAHTCYNSYGQFIRMIEELGLAGELLRREKHPFRFYDQERVVSIGSRLNLGSLFLTLPRALRMKREGRTVREYYGALFGHRNYDRVLRAAFDAVICQQAAEFPAELLFKKRPRRKDYPRSYTFQRGIASVATRILERPGIECRVGNPAVRVETHGQGFRVLLTDGAAVDCTHVALATPPPVAAELLRSVAPIVSAHLSLIHDSEVDTVGVVLPADRIALKKCAGLICGNEPNAPGRFYSTVSRDLIPHARYRGFTFHFPADRTTREERLARAAEVLRINSAAFVHVFEKRNRVPALRRGHQEWLAKCDQLLGNRDVIDPRILITGNYFAGMAIEECVQRSSREWERASASPESAFSSFRM